MMHKLKNRPFLIIASVATLVVAALFWPQDREDSDSPIQRGSIEQSEKPPVAPEANQVPTSREPIAPETLKNHEEFAKRFAAESAKLSATQKDSDALARDLDILASQLDEKKLRFLANTIKDHQADGDQRALAVDLMARNHSGLAAELLADFASSPSPQLNEPRRQEFEVLLRGMAVEGVMQAQEPTQAIRLLNNISSKTDSKFLNDRAQRALRHLSGQAPSPEQQDKKALEKLIK